MRAPIFQRPERKRIQGKSLNLSMNVGDVIECVAVSHLDHIYDRYDVFVIRRCLIVRTPTVEALVPLLPLHTNFHRIEMDTKDNRLLLWREATGIRDNHYYFEEETAEVYEDVFFKLK